ncbi:MAG: hypothetical protein ABSG54_17915 [Terriglobia bacterium]|jgi:hypothetical protein
MTDAKQIPALFTAQSELLHAWADALHRQGHRTDVRQRVELHMREMAGNLQTAATEPDPAKLQPEQEAHA